MNYHLVSIVLFLFIYSVSIIIACKPKGVSNNVLLGQTTYVCLFLGPLEFQKSGKIIQIAAEFKADELSSFTIPGSWTSQYYSNDTLLRKLGITDQNQPGAGLGVTVSSMGIISYQRAYRQVPGSLPPPTSHPSSQPTSQPTVKPSSRPSCTQTIPKPSLQPSFTQTMSPSTILPTLTPSVIPSVIPSYTSSPSFTLSPTNAPSVSPSVYPSLIPSAIPSITPSVLPTTPSMNPSQPPSYPPTLIPSPLPTLTPTAEPSTYPTAEPSSVPTPILTTSPTPSPVVAVVVVKTMSRLLDVVHSSRRLVSSVFKNYFSSESTSTTSNSTKPVLPPVPVPVSTSVTFPILMIIINVNHGAVTDVVWDDTCSWCSSSQCKQNTYNYSPAKPISQQGKNCYVYDSTCVAPGGGTNSHPFNFNTSTNASLLNYQASTELCELKVFVTWTGTDSNGARFKSASERFSRLTSPQMNAYTSNLQSQYVTARA